MTELPTRSYSGEPAKRRLVAFWDDGQFQQSLPANGIVVVGRGDGADARIEHESLSRRHLAIHLEDPVTAVEDLGSRNGSRVRGSRLVPGVRLAVTSSDWISLGAVRLLLEGGTPGGDTGGVVVLLPEDAHWVQIGAGARLDMTRRHVLRRLLLALVMARVRGEPPVTREALIAAAWPEERIRFSAAMNRLYVAITQLRRLGFQDLIVNADDGWTFSQRAALRFS